jgi:hypothetical protein
MGEPSGSHLTLIDHVNRLVCNLRRLTHAVVVFDHIHWDIHTQHAWRAEHQMPHANISANTIEPWALRRAEQATFGIDHKPTLMIFCRIGML